MSSEDYSKLEYEIIPVNILQVILVEKLSSLEKCTIHSLHTTKLYLKDTIIQHCLMQIHQINLTMLYAKSRFCG